MRIDKVITEAKMLCSMTLFFKEKYRDQFEKFASGYKGFSTLACATLEASLVIPGFPHNYGHYSSML